jgi:predicted nuclease of predicted toxin-antitoxin system
MTIWVDAQLSPSLAPWIAAQFGVTAFSLRHLGLQRETDKAIFQAARREGVLILTKDNDFVRLLESQGPPPQILLVTVGNTSNARMKEALTRTLQRALELITQGESLVEIRDADRVS